MNGCLDMWPVFVLQSQNCDLVKEVASSTARHVSFVFLVVLSELCSSVWFGAEAVCLNRRLAGFRDPVSWQHWDLFADVETVVSEDILYAHAFA